MELSPREWADGIEWAAMRAVLIFGHDPASVEAVRVHTDIPIHCYDPGATADTVAPGVTLHTALSTYEQDVTRLALSDAAVAAYAPSAETDRLGPEIFGAWETLTTQVFESCQVERNTEAHFGERWAYCIVETMRRAQGALLLGATLGQAKGAPCAVVGAGPSLDRNAAGLARWKDRGVVVASLTALGALRRHGVEPDVVIASDSSEHLYDLASRLGGHDGLVFLGGLHCDPRIWDLPWRDRILATHWASGWGRSLAERLGVTMTPVAGTVTGLAVGAALEWGCRPICLVGQDCAYAGDEQSIRYHAEGGGCFPGEERITVAADCYAQRAIIDLTSGKPVAPITVVPAWGGEGEVISSRILDHYRRWFEQCARDAHAADQTYQLLNCTEGGSRIAGWREVALDRVIPEAQNPMARILDGRRLTREEGESVLADVVASADALRVRAEESAAAFDAYRASQAAVREAAKGAALAVLASKGAVEATREAGARTGDQERTTATCIRHVADAARAVARQAGGHNAEG